MWGGVVRSVPPEHPQEPQRKRKLMILIKNHFLAVRLAPEVNEEQAACPRACIPSLYTASRATSWGGIWKDQLVCWETGWLDGL